MFICGIAGILIFYFCPSVGQYNTITGAVIFGFLILNYFLAAVINPGIETNQVPNEDLENDQEYNFCTTCKVYKEKNTQHCEECEVCIQEYDHHCPWTSKCIGKGNLTFFYSFLASLLVSFVFSLITMSVQTKI